MCLKQKHSDDLRLEYPRVAAYLTTKGTFIDVARNNEYVEQRTNKIKPLSTCNTTSFEALIEVCGINYDKPDGVKLADHITTVINTDDEIDEIYKRKYSRYGYPKEQIHVLLAMGAAKVCGVKSISKFKTSYKLNDIVWSLVKGKPVVVSGVFAGYNHISPVMGVLSSQEDLLSVTSKTEIKTDQIIGLLIDDTFGASKSRYRYKNRNNNGDNNFYTVDEFRKLIKPVGEDKYWAHIAIDNVCNVTKPINLL